MLKKLYDNFEEIFCVFTMAIMVGCLAIQILIRVTIGSSLAWTEELSRYSFLWTVYIGAVLVAKRNGHVRITAQFLLMPAKVRLAFRLLADIIWVSATLYVAWQSWTVIHDGMEFPEISPTLHILKSYVEMIIPAGFLLLAWRIVEDWAVRFRKGTLLELLQEQEETA
ncbi:MAG: TRAP transporter small permease [Desulfovibrio sp.]|nr:TRAP transporter small permease [Desulfovibrio sp.]